MLKRPAAYRKIKNSTFNYFNHKNCEAEHGFTGAFTAS